MRSKSLNRLEQSLHALPDVPPAVEAPEFDAEQLAREAARAFDSDLAHYRRLGKPEGLDDPREPPPAWRADAAREALPEEFTFADIERLGRVDPALATARWQEVKSAARGDLDSGWLAARALEYSNGSAWARACFKAVRDRLREAWAPRQFAEAILIDQMAQYEVLRQQWIQILAVVSHQPRTIIELNAENRPSERKLGSAGATLEAARMVERLQRLYQSTLRTLLSLRRAASSITVQNMGPMNLALGPQLNVGGPPELDGALIETEAEGRGAV